VALLAPVIAVTFVLGSLTLLWRGLLGADA